jgi:hypothetical protein
MTDNTSSHGKKSWGFRAFAGTALAAVLTIAGYQVSEDLKAENAREELIERISNADVKDQTCPEFVRRGTERVAFESSPDLARTLAPLLDVRDVQTGLTGEKLITHALDQGVRFATCSDMSATAAFAKPATDASFSKPVIKLNVQATDLQQQAAVLQLMKEFYNAGEVVESHVAVTADANLTRYMPGRVLEEDSVSDHIRTKATEYGLPVKIPMRVAP